MLHTLLLISTALVGGARTPEPPVVLPDAVLAPGAQAEYGLFRFGAAEVEMWAVFAKSDPAAPAHDLLFFDLDADGDLTDANERFVGGPEGDFSNEVRGFHIGRLAIPGTNETHTDVHLAHFGWMVEWSLAWRGATTLRGCKGRSYRDGVFGASPEVAPVFVPRLDRPLVFLDYENRAVPAGHTRWFRVVMGSAGLGRGSFSYTDATALPDGEVLQADLHYTDLSGVERTLAFELPHRSCGTIFCGLVDVPAHADPAVEAFVRVRLQADSDRACRPTDLPFEILQLDG